MDSFGIKLFFGSLALLLACQLIQVVAKNQKHNNDNPSNHYDSNHDYSYCNFNNFYDDKVVPDVLDVVPPVCLKVLFPGEIEVETGNIILPSYTVDPPREYDFNYNSNSNYTFIISAEDIPTTGDPRFEEVLLLLVVNAPGGDMSSGDTLAQWFPPTPLAGAGIHRVVISLFEQQNPVESDINIPADSYIGRLNFDTTDFAAANNLSDPVAANYFRTRYDFNTYDILFAKLGDAPIGIKDPQHYNGNSGSNDHKHNHHHRD